VILERKDIYGAEALKIWWDTITTPSQTSDTYMNPCFYVSYLVL